MNTRYTISDLLVIQEITDLSDSMIGSISMGNFTKTPMIYDELFLAVAKILGDPKN